VAGQFEPGCKHSLAIVQCTDNQILASGPIFPIVIYVTKTCEPDHSAYVHLSPRIVTRIQGHQGESLTNTYFKEATR